jgi:rhodanese-related sulfurtransferase
MNRLSRFPSVLFGLVFILYSELAAATPPAVKVVIPDNIPGTTLVDAEGVIALAAKTPDLVIIDARIAGDRKHGFIEGSVSLPDLQTNCASLAKVIPKKSSPVLLYCNGINCGRSVTSTNIALKCGYTRLYWFRGGYEEWMAKNYPTVAN